MEPRPVRRNPVRTSVEVHEHRRIVARGDNPVCDRGFIKLITLQQFGSLGALDAVLSIEDVCGAAIGIAHGATIWQRFDLISCLLTVLAIADTAHDRPAECCEFDATASACCGHGGWAYHAGGRMADQPADVCRAHHFNRRPRRPAYTVCKILAASMSASVARQSASRGTMPSLAHTE